MAAARLNLWLPVVLWAALIFTFSSIPSLGTGLGTWDLVLRKLAHAAEFGVLGALLFRALRREPLAIRSSGIESHDPSSSDAIDQAWSASTSRMARSR